MRLIGVVLPPAAGGGAEPETWVASTEQLDTPTRGAATLVAPLRRFWSDPRAAMAAPDGRGIEVGGDLGAEVVPPVLPEARVLCIGLNYRDHIAEGSFADVEHPPYPTLFARWTPSLVAGGVSAPTNANERGLDWEGEIAAWVGAELRDAGTEEARAAILGYSTFNDLTSRIAQKLTSQWILGKNGDRSGPIGPLVTADEAGDLRDGLHLETRVNGEVVQQSTSDLQIYEAAETLAHISRTLTLRAGDILCTGTPSGVGYARDPEWLLRDGDVVEVEVERLGTLRTPITGPGTR
ncbi:fumarylacetoacetate hydrolase family protein [Leucobacter allii]|uniref:Fumarylacetoacetate hydrolase family protein n=1 Tax=Leucobacter allii TaxID=2932247 RepID=A0ABY4FKM5_9MICO|nr:fumarylacetoacetate hydrolase family protein [Leucobacter allii]UOQ56711.1 fumarylacetoacetate hydrolase family protein [Leucobacter allii]UOR01144.1 fumarylacetoacetate hydrolase family protein [Leucobacter allii]